MKSLGSGESPVLSIRMPKYLLMAVKKAAAESGVSVSEGIRVELEKLLFRGKK
jgi:predicted DNA binding CopG/RHH family protein